MKSKEAPEAVGEQKSSSVAPLTQTQKKKKNVGKPQSKGRKQQRERVILAEDTSLNFEHVTGTADSLNAGVRTVGLWGAKAGKHGR